MSDIAIRSAKNGGPTISDVLTALVAKNDDDDLRAESLREETIEAKKVAHDLSLIAQKTAQELALSNDTDHKLIIKSIDEHLVMANDFFGRVVKLEAYKEDSERTCVERVKSLIKFEHDSVHAQHMQDDHPPAEPLKKSFSGVSDQTLSEIILGWRFTKWIAGIILIVAVGWVLPFYASSCAASKAEEDFAHKEVPLPTMTITVTPSPLLSP